MIVDCAVYEKGQRREGQVSPEEATDACRTDDRFVWLGLKDPSAEELEGIALEFGLPELAVEDAIHAHQRPKVENYDDLLFLVLKSVRYVDSEEVLEIGELQLFVHPDFIISVRHGAASSLSKLRHRIDRRPDLAKYGPAFVMHSIVDQIVDDYDLAADGIEVDIQEVEDEVFSPDRSNPAPRIYFLEREILQFQRSAVPLVSPVEQLAKGHYEAVPDELHHYFRDVHDHLLRSVGRIRGCRELLSSALQANLTQVAVRQNDDMRRISAWVAIAAVPTAIAGIYGMNFDHMPELRWQYGYPLILSLIATVCVVLYVRFRKAGWL